MPEPFTREQAMSRTYTVREAADAANVTRYQIESWVTRGFIKPSHTPVPPESRQYKYHDVFNIAVFAEMMRFGFPAAKYAGSVWAKEGIGFVESDGSLGVLVFWQAPRALLGVAPPGGLSPVHEAKELPQDISATWIDSRVFHTSEIRDVLADSEKRALVMVNLAHVESRVLTRLAELA